MYFKVAFLKRHVKRCSTSLIIGAFLVAQMVKKKKKFPFNAGDPGSIPGLGRSPGEGSGYPIQYSCLENSMDRGAWRGYSPWGHKESDKISLHTRQKVYHQKIHKQ